MIKKDEIYSKMKIAAEKRDRYTYESAEYSYWDDKIAELSKDLEVIRQAESPLTRDLAAEKAWFNAQGFKDVATANKACLDRGYSLAELQMASKAAKTSAQN